MKNINLITFVSLFVAFLLSFNSGLAMAQSTGLEQAMNTSLTFEDDFLKEDEAFIASFDQQNDQLTMNVKIAPGYYLYRHRFKFEGNQLTLRPVELPTGITHQDEYFGVQQVYKKDLSFIVEIEKATPNASVNVTYQGCAAKGLCYLPITKTIMVNKVNTK